MTPWLPWVMIQPMGTGSTAQISAFQPAPRAEVLARLEHGLRGMNGRVCGVITDDRAELYLPTLESSLSAPQLIVLFEEKEMGTCLRWRFGPHPYLWAAALGMRAVASFLVLLSGSFAYAQCTLGERPWALLGLSVAGVLFLSGSWLCRLQARSSTAAAREPCQFVERSVSAGS